MSKPYLAVAAIARDEALNIEEWIAFHEVVGVEHFYVYDNDSDDDTYERLAGRPNVTIIGWPGERQQAHAYAHALDRCRAEWLAFLDVDEFLYSPSYLPVPTVLRNLYRRYDIGRDAHPDAFGVCWAMFGTSDIEQRPLDGVVRNFTRRAAADDPAHRHIKSIVRLSQIPRQVPIDPHHFRCVTFDTLGRRVEGALAQTPTWEALRINHYHTKSVEEARAKERRPRADNGELRPGILALPFNVEVDRGALPYVPLMEARL